ncbi:MAG: hypothetical protein GY865_10245, partial [candidate division Zixibacteria bacterium]|nr:hypothetical protein [candidate division Zixibacteria bacterium]
ISPSLGYYEYTPTEEGSFDVIFMGTDGEGEPIYFTKTYIIYYNRSPIITNGGIIEKIAVIGEELAYDVNATDSESDPFTFSLISGAGLIDENTGMLTFTPEDYGIYEFEVAVTDSCGADTSLITFDIILGFVLECPPDEVVDFICQPDTLCYPIGGIPDEASVTVEPSSAWYDIETNSVCFYTNCSVVKDIKVIVSTQNTKCDDCPPIDIDSCMFTADVTLNSFPIAMLPEDQSIWLCEPSEICIPAGIDDIDNNITDILVEILPGGQIGEYSEITGSACFTPTESGNYKLILTALDECDASDVDTINLDVTINTAPTAVCSEIQELTVCDLSDLTLSGFVCDDIDGNLVSCEVDNGIISNGEVTFSPVEGENSITLTATDECGAITTCQTIVIITLNSPPTATCPLLQDLLVCDLSPVIVNGFEFSDLDGNLQSADVDNGTLAGNEVTFIPVEGENIITLTVTDDCGEVTTCQTIVNIALNRAPMVACPPSEDLFVCDLSPITISGFSYIDLDGNMLSAEVNYGVLDGGDVTLTPVEGRNNITIAITDECGETAKCYTDINVILNTAPTVTCPPQQELFVCDLSDITIDGFLYEDIDGNITNAEVNNGVLSGNEVTFTPIDGENIIELAVTDECGEVTTCETTILVTLNSPPTATCPDVKIRALCDLSPITLSGFICDDIDGNLISCVVDNGTLDGNDVTFTPIEGENVITLTATDECGEVTTCQTIVNIVLNTAPTVSVPDDLEMFVCDMEPITLSGFICDDKYGNLISCEVNNGTLDGNDVTFTPVEGENVIKLTATDECGLFASDQVVINVTLNSAPTVSCPGDQELFLCDLSPVTLQGFDCDDIDGNLISCETDNGIINGTELTFTPVAGENIITLTATDECGDETTCQITIFVTINNAPTATCPGDLELFVCDLSDITIPGFVCDDIDGDLINCEVNNGILSDDVVTFTPIAGINTITLTATDECGVITTCQTSVTVTLNSAPTASVPEPNELFVCDLSDITIPGFTCDDIDGNLINCDVNNGILNGDAVTFTPIVGLNTISLTATDECGLVTTNQTTVMITMNSAPIANCPENLQMQVCDLSTIIIDGFLATDADGNIVLFEVDNGNLFEEQVEFTPVEGENIINYTVTDECGATSTCQTIVNITLNSPPTITCPPTQELLVCDLSDVTLPGFLYEDIDGNIISADVDNGILTGNDVTFMPVVGENIITLTVIDDCDALVSCQTIINVTLNNAPTAVTPENQDLYLCDLSQVSIDGFICDDIDGNLANCEVSNGTLNGTELTFTPVAGANIIILTATDECGEMATSEFIVNIDIAPTFELTCPQNSSIFLCEPATLNYPIYGIPDNATVTVNPPSASYNAETGKVGFYTNCSVVRDIEVIVETDCHTEICQFTVTATMNSAPLVALGPDQSEWLCDPAEICFPAGISDVDDNISNISIDVQPFDPNAPAASYNDISGQICFTPTTTDQYVVYVTATDECDSVATDSIVIDVVLDSAPTVSCPQEQKLLVCDLTDITISDFIY